MIKEFAKFAGPYSLKGNKSYTTDRGIAWFANVYKGKVKIGSVSNDGNGGCTYVNVSEEELNLLESHIASLPNKKLDIESFFEYFGDYAASIKKFIAKNKKNPVQVEETNFDENGIPTNILSYKCSNTPENLQHILKKYPNARLLSFELELI